MFLLSAADATIRHLTIVASPGERKMMSLDKANDLMNSNLSLISSQNKLVDISTQPEATGCLVCKHSALS